MSTKSIAAIFILIPAFILLVNCASMQVKKEDSVVYKKYSYDKVWNAALEALKEMEFTVVEAEKGITLPAFSEQKGTIHAAKSKKILIQVKDPQVYVTIRKQEADIFVYCQVVQPGQFMDYGISKGSIKKFFKLLDIKLKK